jgi:hypothetical protein
MGICFSSPVSDAWGSAATDGVSVGGSGGGDRKCVKGPLADHHPEGPLTARIGAGLASSDGASSTSNECTIVEVMPPGRSKAGLQPPATAAPSAAPAPARQQPAAGQPPRSPSGTLLSALAMVSGFDSSGGDCAVAPAGHAAAAAAAAARPLEPSPAAPPAQPLDIPAAAPKLSRLSDAQRIGSNNSSCCLEAFASYVPLQELRVAQRAAGLCLDVFSVSDSPG